MGTKLRPESRWVVDSISFISSFFFNFICEFKKTMNHFVGVLGCFFFLVLFFNNMFGDHLVIHVKTWTLFLMGMMPSKRHNYSNILKPKCQQSYLFNLSVEFVSVSDLCLAAVPPALTSSSNLVVVLHVYAYYQSCILAFRKILVQTGYQWFDLIWNVGYFSQGEVVTGKYWFEPTCDSEVHIKYTSIFIFV